MSNNQPAITGEGLKRELGVIDIAASVANVMIGSGIYLLPALVAAALGSASILAYILCGASFLCIILCFVEMSGRITDSGGAYVYIEKAFGPFAGFITNNLLWVGGVLISAALVNGIADMLSVPFPVFSKLIPRFVLFALLLGFTCYSNITGVKQSMRTAKALVVLKILPLLLIVVVGLFRINFNNLSWQGFPASEQLGPACLLLSAAFVGGESAASFGGEMKNPKRTGPLGLLLGAISVTIFYMLIQSVAQGELGSSLAAQKAPLAEVAKKQLGSWALTLLLIGGIISVFGTLYSCVMSFSRVMFAGGFNNLLPRFLAKTHPKYATPHWAIITICLLGFLFACSGGYRLLIVVATISVMLTYVGVALALIKFKLTNDQQFPATGFKTPGGILVPVIALLALGWLLWHSQKNEVVGLAIFIGLLVFIYVGRLFFVQKKTRRENGQNGF